MKFYTRIRINIYF